MAEEEIVINFPEWQVNSFDVDCTGNWAVLAVQKWLAIISLDSTDTSGSIEIGSGEGREKAKRKLGTSNKYDIKALKWNPHFSKQHLLASTNHQKLDVWDTHEGRQPFLSVKAHTRPISDLSWSFDDPNLIATCAVESYVHIWDIREYRRPKVSFKTLGGLNSGASFVQWNRLNGSLIGSAHDSDIRIWDMKKPSTVSACITAHMNKIHDIDWSYSNERHLTTCSHDASIKFWDIQSSRDPHSTIKTGTHPIWRAKNCPYGEGLAMILVPAVHSGDNRVFLWSRTNIATPTHIFNGHKDAVIDIQWKKHNRSCQLLSLSKDRSLRIWPISDQLQQDLHFDTYPSSPFSSSSSLYGNSKNETPSINSGEQKPHPQPIAEAETSFCIEPNSSSISSEIPGTPVNRSLSGGIFSSNEATPTNSIFGMSASHTLTQEFDQVNLDIPNLEMERLDATQRTCTVKIEQGDHMIRVGITFPFHYPNGAAPSFILDNSTTIDTASQQELIRIVNETAYTNVKANRPCLELCLRKLAKGFENLLCRPEPPSDHTMPNVASDFDLLAFGKLDDDRIPFPRTCGARFCSNGYLVCFSSPKLHPLNSKAPKSLDYLQQYKMFNKKGQKQKTSSSSLSSLVKKTGSGGNLQSMASSPLMSTAVSINRERSGSIGLLNKDKNLVKGVGGTGGMFVGGAHCTETVVISDVCGLLPFDYNLAKSYSLIGKDIQELCTINACTAASYGRQDLVSSWTALSLIADTNIDTPSLPNSGSPWAFHPFGAKLVKSLFNHYSKLHDVQMLAMLACICQLQCIHVEEYFSTINKQSTPAAINGSSPPLIIRKTTDHGGWEDLHLVIDNVVDDEEMILQQQHQTNCKLLDDIMCLRCDEYRRCYGNILYGWGLITQRSEVMKYQCLKQTKQPTLSGQCRKCHSLLKGPYCMKCHLFAITCAVCNMAVKGCSNLCLNCGHGGHTHHLMDWFKGHMTCPSGCGCRCLETSGWSQ